MQYPLHDIYNLFVPRYQFFVVFGATIWSALLFPSISGRNNQSKCVHFLHRTSTVPSVTVCCGFCLSRQILCRGFVRGTSAVSTIANYVLVNSVAFPIFNICAAKSERLLQQRKQPHLINLFKKFLTFCWPCILVYSSQYLTNFMHKIYFTVSFISCLYMFRAHVLIIRKSKLHYTASGIITPIGQNCITQPLVSSHL